MQICIPQTSGIDEFISKFDDKVILTGNAITEKHGPFLVYDTENRLLTGSYHKRQISNPPTPLPPMFKTAKVQFRQCC